MTINPTNMNDMWNEGVRWELLGCVFGFCPLRCDFFVYLLCWPSLLFLILDMMAVDLCTLRDVQGALFMLSPNDNVLEVS
jgi:hypothetical protein